ncbi:MAG: response regulator transcription factor [Chloroflexi bacterium]|nr:response regulator transcription factor [Chloroflexota bacterium]
MAKVRVFLADWQILFREGMHFTLSGEEDFEVIGEATDNKEALKLLEANPPHVAILNADHSEFSGIDLTRRIKQNYPTVSVIMVMDTDNVEVLLQAVKSGASACLTKEADPDELLSTIRKVAKSEYPISQALLRPEIASRIIDEFAATASLNEEVGHLLARLSPTESEILRRIASGGLLEEITRSLNISEEDVKRHLELIRAKLLSNDHSRALIEAAQSNLTSIISKIAKAKEAGKPTRDYITKEEFSTFKDNLREYFQTLMNKLG